MVLKAGKKLKPLTVMSCQSCIIHSKGKYQNFEKNIPREGIARPFPNFDIHVSMSDLFFPQLVWLFCSRKIYVPTLGIYKSHTDTKMWIPGTVTVQFLFWEHIKWDFNCSVGQRYEWHYILLWYVYSLQPLFLFIITLCVEFV